MIFNLLILMAIFGVIGVVTTIVSDRRRRNVANKKWEEIQNERKSKAEKDDNLLS